MASPKISTVSRGFSLLELLIVIGLLALVGGFTLLVSMDSYKGHSFHSERDRLISVIQKARSQAINNMCFGGGCTDGKAHGVHIDSNQFTIFQGSSWATRDAALDEVVPLESKSITLSGLTDVVFTQLSGTAALSPSGASLLIKDTAGKDTSTITFNAEGRICIDDPSC